MNIFDNKKVLITGATGMICSSFIQYLITNTTAKVYALGRSDKKLREVFSSYLGERLVTLAQDVSEEIKLDDTVDYIFHGAGPIDSTTIKTKPVDVILPNIKGLLNCANIAISQKNNGKVNPRIIVFSSATVYDILQNENNNEDSTFSEDSPLYTTNLSSGNACYFESKRMSEVLAKSLITQYQLDIMICRFAYVYGVPYFKPNTAFYQFIDTVKNNNDIVMNNAGLGRRDNIFIDDVTSALSVICEKGEIGEVYNISSNGDKDNFAAIDEMAKVMVELANSKRENKVSLTYKVQSDNTKRTKSYKLDNCKLKKLGWNIQVSLNDGIEKILKTYEII